MANYLSKKPIEFWHWDPNSRTIDLITSFYTFVAESKTRDSDYNINLEFTPDSELVSIIIVNESFDEEEELNIGSYLVVEGKTLKYYTKQEFLQNFQEVK